MITAVDLSAMAEIDSNTAFARGLVREPPDRTLTELAAPAADEFKSARERERDFGSVPPRCE